MTSTIELFNELSLGKIQEVRLAARRKVEIQHSETQMVVGMENLYKEIIQARNP